MIESAAEFVRLRTSNEQSEYWRAAHEEAPVHVWMAVIRDYPDMRFWVAQNKTVPVEVLEVLAKADDCRVRSMVAAKRKLPLELQHLLAKDSDDSVRAELARNAKVADEVLDALASETGWVGGCAREMQRRRAGDAG